MQWWRSTLSMKWVETTIPAPAVAEAGGPLSGLPFKLATGQQFVAPWLAVVPAQPVDAGRKAQVLGRRQVGALQ